jgi:arylsulfatase A-like enzyme
MQTQFGQFLATVAESLEKEAADCVWIHAKAFSGAWDAPFELRLALTDEEEDPDPSRSVEPPDDHAWSHDDPDTAWSLARAYAAQVMSVDRCLEFLFEVLNDAPAWRDALWIVTSPRGYPLGEHDKVGLMSSPEVPLPLHGEVLHVPLFVRQPTPQSPLLRSQALVQPTAVLPTILDWLRIADESLVLDSTSLLRLFDEQVGNRREFDRAVSRADDDLSIRTPGWFMRLANCGGDAMRGEALLYVKPDDRWEANEVADLCREVVDALRETLHDFVKAVETDDLNNLRELPDLLYTSTI